MTRLRVFHYFSSIRRVILMNFGVRTCWTHVNRVAGDRWPSSAHTVHVIVPVCTGRVNPPPPMHILFAFRMMNLFCWVGTNTQLPGASGKSWKTPTSFTFLCNGVSVWASSVVTRQAAGPWPPTCVKMLQRAKISPWQVLICVFADARTSVQPCVTDSHLVCVAASQSGSDSDWWR